MATAAHKQDTAFESDFARALEGDKTQTQLRDTLRKLAESEPEAFVRGIRVLMSD
jgi:hypothetical protein